MTTCTLVEQPKPYVQTNNKFLFYRPGVCLLTFVYLFSFTQYLDAYGIMIMLFDPTDTQQLSQDSLILLFVITSDYTKYIKKGLS